MGKWIAAAVLLTLWYGLPPIINQLGKQAVQEVDIDYSQYR